MQTKHYKFTTVNQRENNEDSCLAYDLIVDNRLYSVLLLSDGMGGHDYGELISNTVMSNLSMLINKSILEKAIIPQLENSESEKKENAIIDFEKVLQQAIEVTNHKVRQLVTNNKWKSGGATLVAVIVLDNNKYVWGYLGDSRLYHYSSEDKKLNQIGFDHNVPGILLNEGAITPEIAKNHAQKNEIVYYMGIESIPDIKKVKFVGTNELKQNDILLLFTDGMTNKLNISSFETQMPKVSHQNINSVFNSIVDFTQKQGEKDNQTMVIYINSEQIKEEIKKLPEKETIKTEPKKEEIKEPIKKDIIETTENKKEEEIIKKLVEKAKETKEDSKKESVETTDTIKEKTEIKDLKKSENTAETIEKKDETVKNDITDDSKKKNSFWKRILKRK